MRTYTMSQLFREEGVCKIYSRKLTYTESRVLVTLQAVCFQLLIKNRFLRTLFYGTLPKFFSSNTNFNSKLNF